MTARRRRAFTLIELLVVILVIAILIAVAAPAFLGQQHKAHDSHAKQNLTIAYRAGKAVFTSADATYVQGTAADAAGAATLFGQLKASEPQLVFANSVSSVTPNQVQVTAGGDVATYAVRSRSGRVFCLQTVERVVGAIPAGVYRAEGTGASACSTLPQPPTVDISDPGPSSPDYPELVEAADPLVYFRMEDPDLTDDGPLTADGAGTWTAGQCQTFNDNTTDCFPSAYDRWPQFDSSGHAYHNFYIVPQAAGNVIVDAPGKFGQGTRYRGGFSSKTNPGSIGAANISTTQAPLSSFSTDFWIRVSPGQTSTNTGVFSVGREYDMNHGYEQLFGAGLRMENGQMQFFVGQSTTSWQTFGPDLRDDAWHHVAFTRDVPNRRLLAYVDGTQAASYSTTASNDPTFAYTIHHVFTGTSFGDSKSGAIGQFTPTIFFTMDEVALYRGVLTPEQISAHAAAG